MSSVRVETHVEREDGDIVGSYVEVADEGSGEVVRSLQS